MLYNTVDMGISEALGQVTHLRIASVGRSGHVGITNWLKTTVILDEVPM